MIELEIVLVRKFGRFFQPQGSGSVHHLVAVGGLHAPFLPFLLLAADYRHGQETAIFFQKSVYARLLQKLLAFIIDIQDNIGASLRAVALLHGILRRAVAFPAHGLCSVFIAKRVDDNFLGHHERRIESETEVAYDAVGAVLVFGQELFRSGEGYLIDVFVKIIGVHADAMVAHCQCAGFFIDAHAHIQCAQFSFEFAESGQCAELLCGIYGIAYKLTQKNLVVAVQELLDYRKDILGGYTYFAFLHISVV